MQHITPSPFFKLPPKLRAVTSPSLEHVTGYYVYEWQDREIPFYVGYGKLRKAWNLHNLDAEDTKRFSKDFRVVIVQQNLTKLQAQDLKRSLVYQYRKDNVYLSNER